MVEGVRFLIIVAELAAVVGAAFLIYWAVAASVRGRPRRALPGGRWQPHHFAEAGHTVVTVSRLTASGKVIEEHVVARIPDTDEDWSTRFVQAKLEAEERAFHLNAGNP